MNAKELDKDTWLITRGEGQGSTHNYLLAGEDKAALLDTGLKAEELRDFAASLTDKPIVVVHTHGHIDHIGNDQQFEEIMLHPKDFDLYRLHSSADFRRDFFKGQPDEDAMKQPINQGIELQPLAEGMIIDLGGRVLKVIENPGHTHGGVSLIEEVKKTIYTGDMVCEMGVLMHFPESTSIETYKRSLTNLRSAITADYQLYPGHQQVPLSVEWIDAYIACADELIELGKQLTKKNPADQGTAEVQFHSKGKATISYTSEKLMKSRRT